MESNHVLPPPAGALPLSQRTLHHSPVIAAAPAPIRDRPDQSGIVSDQPEPLLRFVASSFVGCLQQSHMRLPQTPMSIFWRINPFPIKQARKSVDYSGAALPLDNAQRKSPRRFHRGLRQKRLGGCLRSPRCCWRLGAEAQNRIGTRASREQIEGGQMQFVHHDGGLKEGRECPTGWLRIIDAKIDLSSIR